MTPTPPRPASVVRMFYVDDSGAEDTGYIVYSWIECTARNWAAGLMFVPAHRSHWVQMADIVAWSAYQGLLRHPGKRFAWDWYERYLGPSDVNGGPLAL